MLLYHLESRRGCVVPQETLLARVWGIEYREEVQYLKVYIRRLRAKLEADPAHLLYIHIVRGAGYMFPGENA